MENLKKEQQFYRTLICKCIEFTEKLKSEQNEDNEKNFYYEKSEELNTLLRNFDIKTNDIIQFFREL